MIEAMDEAAGLVLDALDRFGLAEDDRLLHFRQWRRLLRIVRNVLSDRVRI